MRIPIIIMRIIKASRMQIKAEAVVDVAEEKVVVEGEAAEAVVAAVTHRMLLPQQTGLILIQHIIMIVNGRVCHMSNGIRY
jgi:hypothetical protein